MSDGLWLTSHCHILTCVISAWSKEKIASFGVRYQEAFQSTICYLALMTCINKQTNMGVLALLLAPQPFVMVLEMGDNNSVRTGNGKIFEVGKG